MPYLVLIGTIILVLVTGLVRIRRSINAIVINHNFISEFRDKFIEFSNPYLDRKEKFFAYENPQSTPDNRLYHWLVSNMDRTQNLLGIYGILSHYTTPFGRFQAQNYPLIINTVPQFRTENASREDLLMCDDMMVRYIGNAKRDIDTEENKSKNPFLWLRSGIQFYVGFPLRLLNWFGIISDSSFSKITSSQIFKIISGLSGLIAFLASLIQILQAWPFVIGLF